MYEVVVYEDVGARLQLYNIYIKLYKATVYILRYNEVTRKVFNLVHVTLYLFIYSK